MTDPHALLAAACSRMGLPFRAERETEEFVLAELMFPLFPAGNSIPLAMLFLVARPGRFEPSASGFITVDLPTSLFKEEAPRPAPAIVICCWPDSALLLWKRLHGDSRKLRFTQEASMFDDSFLERFFSDDQTFAILNRILYETLNRFIRNFSDLERFALLSLNRPADQFITHTDKLPTALVRIIDAAWTHGRLPELIAAAQAEAADDPSLRLLGGLCSTLRAKPDRPIPAGHSSEGADATILIDNVKVEGGSTSLIGIKGRRIAPGNSTLIVKNTTIRNGIVNIFGKKE